MLTDDLRKYIEQCLTQGMTPSEVVGTLLAGGWSDVDANAVLAEYLNLTATTISSTQPPSLSIVKPTTIAVASLTAPMRVSAQDTSLPPTPPHVRFMGKTAWFFVITWCVVFATSRLLPQLVSADVSFAVSFMLITIASLVAPIVTLAVLLFLFFAIRARKKGYLKPSSTALIVITLLAILPIISTLSFTKLVVQTAVVMPDLNRQIAEKISQMYTTDIDPALAMHRKLSTSTLLLVPSKSAESLFTSDFAFFYQEGRTDGTEYEKVYRNINNTKEGVQRGRFLLNSKFTYPESFISIKGDYHREVTGTPKRCEYRHDYAHIPNIHREKLDEYEIALHTYEDSNLRFGNHYYGTVFRNDACVYVDFVRVPQLYTKEYMIKILLSLVRSQESQISR